MSLRWGWSLLTVFLVVVVATSMTFSIAEIEKRAWAKSEQAQAKLLITLLADELKMPMLAGSAAEVDTLVKMFAHQVEDVTIYLRWTNGEYQKYGDGPLNDTISALSGLPAQAVAVANMDKWYATGVKYNTTQLGTIAMLVPGKSWAAYDSEIKLTLAAVAAVIALLAALFVYLRTGRIVDHLRMLARGSKRVGGGDFSVYIPIPSHNEFGKAFNQFNLMVSSLEQREKIYDLYGNYQRPERVADEYERNAQRADKTREVSLLAMEMVDFSGFMNKSSQEDTVNTLNRYFALFQATIQEFGGHVDRYNDDTMIAVFNHPFDLKNHENQAAKAGMALIEVCSRLSVKRADGEELQFRVGMAIGEVMLGHLGVGRRKKLTIVGDAITLATNMAKISDGTSVTAPYGTMLSLGHGFRQKELGMRLLANAKEARCITIHPGEAYVEQELDEVVSKVMLRLEPGDFIDDDDDDQW